MTENDDENEMTDENNDETEPEGEGGEIKPKNIQCEEDDEFVKMFDTLMTTEQNVATSKTGTGESKTTELSDIN